MLLPVTACVTSGVDELAILLVVSTGSRAFY